MERKRAELVRSLATLIREPNRFPSGQLPPERDLAKRLGVSRNLLREAIITLEVMGVLEIRERQGAFIVSPNAPDFTASLKLLSLWPNDILSDLMEMRLVIEVPAAGLAAQRRTRGELDRMWDCLHHLESAQDSPDHGPATGATWDSLLHTLVLNAAHNPLLSRLYEGLSSTMERYIVISRTKLLSLGAWSTKVLGEHRALVKAIEAHKSDTAMAALRRHLEGALTKLNELRREEAG